MPTLQQLNDNIAIATTELANATSAAQTANANLNRCNCGGGKLTIKREGVPAGTCTPLMNSVSFPNLADVSQCIAKQVTSSCKTDCCSKDTCVANVNIYNSSIGAYNTAVSNLANANAALSTAASTDPEVKNQIQDLKDQDKNRQMKNAIIWVIVIAVIGGVSYFLYKKYGK